MIRAVVVTVSTRAAAGAYPDEAGPAVARELAATGCTVGPVVVVPDGRAAVADALLAACADADVVLTTGGTGMAPSDETPEATSDVIDRPAPGIAEAMRAASLAITPAGMLSRGVAGTRGATLIVNLPGSPKAAVENLRVILPILTHAVEQLRGGDH